MFNRQPFIACVVEQAERFRFGEKRTKAILDRFNGLADGYRAQGMGDVDAEVHAMSRVFNEVATETSEKAKRAMATFVKVGEVSQRFKQAEKVITAKGFVSGGQNAGAAIARAAASFLERDARFKGGNYDTAKHAIRGQLWALANDIVERMGKGVMGRQKGSAHMPNVVRELFGRDSGDAVAKEIAAAWGKTTDAGVDLFNLAGGSLAKRRDWRLPQAQASAKIVKAGEAEWTKFHMDALDWSKMAWPDGSPIRLDERAKVLKEVYWTLATNGVNKIKPGAFNGRGGALGNMLDEHRFMVFKDADAWLEMHARYGEGNLFDVMSGHIEHMAHNTALVQTFGPNPKAMAETIRAYALKTAEQTGDPAAIRATEGHLKNTFGPVFDIVTRVNPLDPESGTGRAVTTLGSILTSAQLGAAALLAIPGDFMTTALVRKFNHMNVFGGVDFYLKALLGNPTEARQIATQAGFVMDEAISSIYATQRFTGVAAAGPAMARRVSDGVMRLSGLSGHTRAARYAVQAEFMGLMARDAGKSFDALPYKAVMERYGIGAKEWDTLRAIQPHSPRPGVSFLRPIDLLETDLPNKQDLYLAFQGMIFDESRTMVPEATLEAATIMKGTTRPDTLIGAIAYSFSMYKNFAVSMPLIYGRLAMTNPNRAGRLGFAGGLIAGMTLVGALGVQLREISKGKTPLPMDTPEFLGKALLAGGGLSIWGDFLFGSVNQFGRGPAETVAGPIVGFAGDATNLLFGDAFTWAGNLGTLGDKESKTLSRAVEFAKRYTPGSSVWWARLAMERMFFDRMTELADPRAYQKFQSKARKQTKEYGNRYWWAPGETRPNL